MNKRLAEEMLSKQKLVFGKWFYFGRLLNTNWWFIYTRTICVLIGAMFVIGAVLNTGYFYLDGIVGRSHLEGNLPDDSVFAEYLARDLSTYLAEKLGEEVQVTYVLLRDEPDQAGLAYPKFYVWVSAITPATGEVVEEAAVRIAAQENLYFIVTDYISMEEIKDEHEALNAIFPQDVVSEIKKRVQ